MGIEEFMENLRQAIWNEISKNDYTKLHFSVICEISYENLNKILSGERKDISVSTILKICENSDINIEDLFGMGNIALGQMEVLVRFHKKLYTFSPPP